MIRNLYALYAVVAMSTIGVRTGLTISDPAGMTLPGALVNLFSYFTILTNTLAAVALGSIAINPNGWAAKPSLQAAVALYISVVGIVYHVLLASTMDRRARKSGCCLK